MGSQHEMTPLDSRPTNLLSWLALRLGLACGTVPSLGCGIRRDGAFAGFGHPEPPARREQDIADQGPADAQGKRLRSCHMLPAFLGSFGQNLSD